MAKSRYVVQWNAQPMHLTKVLCSLLESQTLVDLTVNCNSYTIKVHKCVLAANSVYFRDHLQKDMSIDRVVVNSIKHTVLKALIEYMYCGETSIPDENMDELIAAAKFFCIRGISAIVPKKLGGNHGSELAVECHLLNKPPLFFSTNDKKYTFKEKDNLYETLGRRKHSHTKVADEAHVALAKEEAASRYTIEMLQNQGRNVFVIDETCTEATVETNLTAQYENTDNVMQIQEYVIQNKIINDNSELANEENLVENIDINELLPKKSPNDAQMNEIPNVPILYKPNESAYVNVNVSNQILDGLQNSHEITYHVMPEDENVDFQQYIYNGFDQYSLEFDNIQPAPSYEIVNTIGNETKKPLTFTELVADTVSSDYDHAYAENPPNYETIQTKNEEYVPEEKQPPKMVTEEYFASNYNENFGTETLNVRGQDVLIENIVTPKKKRGRPPKRKLLEKNIESDPAFQPDQKVSKLVVVPTEVMDQNVDNSVEEIINVENENDREVENVNPNEQSNDTESHNIVEQNVAFFNANRRHTRSSFKF